MDVLALLQVWKAKQFLRISFSHVHLEEDSKVEDLTESLKHHLRTLQNYWHSSK